MSTYKVIQDIEAEDKLVGPLSFRQFIYALIAAFCFYISFICLTHGAAFLLVAFLPPGLVSGFFAFPFGKDQPTEVWALAKIRFIFKPRKRIWDQSGVKELVTITVPKKIKVIRTDGLSMNEVQSRLSALANTIDSRGWAVKNVNLNLASQLRSASGVVSGSDRLIDSDTLPQEVPTDDIVAADDILDEQNNPIAQQFDQMIAASTHAHREQIMAMMHAPAASTPAPSAAPVTGKTDDYWFLQKPVQQTSGQGQTNFAQPQVSTNRPQAAVVPAADPTADEEAFALQLKAERAMPTAAYGHLKTIQPLGTDAGDQPAQSTAQTDQPVSPATPTTTVTPGPSPAILELAGNNDLNVATLARQAHKASGDLPKGDDGEVVIALR